MPSFLLEKLNVPTLLAATQRLTTTGTLRISTNKLIYLDIDDAYIHLLQPVLQQHVDSHIKKPNYFTAEKNSGAHITVMYPEENIRIQSQDLDKIHAFSVKEVCLASLGALKYIVLLVQAPSLVLLRQKYSLPETLLFKQHWIPLHITIGKY